MSTNEPAQRTVAQKRAIALRQHFFRRFFDNDTLSPDGETETTVVRALCFCAVPGLMIAFWLLPHYPGRAAWGAVGDRYVFVLLSFVALGFVTTFEWEMLFPDRADFQILLPLPLQPWELLIAKGRALLAFLGLFLAATNVLSLIIFPVARATKDSTYIHSLMAHGLATAAAGICSAASVLALEGLCISVLPLRWMRAVAPVMQACCIAFLLLMLCTFPLCVPHMQAIFEGNAPFARYVPPLWFLGLYERLIAGSSAPAMAWPLASTGLYVTLSAVTLALATYPLAWVRQKRYALEGTRPAKAPRFRLIHDWVHRYLLHHPQERAVFHFIHQTLRRNTRYQVYLAIYAGVGMAFAVAAALTVQVTAQAKQHTIALAVSDHGLHAVLPLLLFWLAVGLRVAFGFPVDMRARWVFAMNLLRGSKHARATGKWALLCSAALTACVIGGLAFLGWRGNALIEQLIWGAALSLLLADIFFFHTVRIPFTYPRLPRRATLPITLLLFAVAFPGFVILTVYLEIRSEAHWVILARVLVGVAAIHGLLTLVSRYRDAESFGRFLLEEDEDEFQTLGLSAF